MLQQCGTDLLFRSAVVCLTGQANDHKRFEDNGMSQGEGEPDGNDGIFCLAGWSFEDAAVKWSEYLDDCV